MNPYKILVTGGAGFIGSNLVEKLVELGHIVTVLDNFSHCRPGQLDKVIDKITVLEVDILEEESVLEATKDKDYIIHLAAQKSVDSSIKFPVASGKQNILTLVNILEGAKKHNVKRVIFVSSAAVYGYNDNFPLKENEILDPRSPYALEKVIGEQYLSLYYKLYGLDSVSLRLFNVYGPRQYSSGTHCGGVTIVMNELKTNNIGNILGDGLQTRDMIYVGDVVDGIVCAINASGSLKGETINICTGKRNSINSMISNIAKIMNIDDYKLNELPFAVHSEGSTEKAKELIGFKSKIELEYGLKLTYDWFLETPGFYNNDINNENKNNKGKNNNSNNDNNNIDIDGNKNNQNIYNDDWFKDISILETSSSGFSKRVNEIREIFEGKFHSPPTYIVRSPGRVNLIGEHIDYSGFDVMPMAIENDVIIAVSLNQSDDTQCEVYNVDSRFESGKFDVSEIAKEPLIDPTTHNWINYIKCAYRGIIENEYQTLSNMKTFNAVVHGIIPAGFGLSSSSALVCASALAIMLIHGISLSRVQLAKLCQECERFIGTMGGGMDQAISLLAEANFASRISFHPIQAKKKVLPKNLVTKLSSSVFCIANSLVLAEKAVDANKYFNKRLASMILIKKLKKENNEVQSENNNITLSQVLLYFEENLLSKIDCSDNQTKFEEMKKKVKLYLHEQPYIKTEIASELGISINDLLSPNYIGPLIVGDEFYLHQRAYHVYHESSLVENFYTSSDIKELGRLMNESHNSCDVNYDCSCVELNELVDICRKAGALGSRLTGAGWGGCVVSLVSEESFENFYESVKKNYYEKYSDKWKGDINEFLFKTGAGEGAFVIKL